MLVKMYATDEDAPLVMAHLRTLPVVDDDAPSWAHLMTEDVEFSGARELIESAKYRHTILATDSQQRVRIYAEARDTATTVQAVQLPAAKINSVPRSPENPHKPPPKPPLTLGEIVLGAVALIVAFYIVTGGGCSGGSSRCDAGATGNCTDDPYAGR